MAGKKISKRPSVLEATSAKKHKTSKHVHNHKMKSLTKEEIF